jgi:hypothetical protein
MNRDKQEQDKRLQGMQFEHAARQYYLRCAQDALPLAPLPEFKLALEYLEWYDREPTKANRKRLMKVYRDLLKGRRYSRRAYGYTAVGEFYNGLVHILGRTLLHPDEVCSSSVAYFAEAHWCAARHLHISTAFDWAEDKAMRLAYERYWKIYEELFFREEEAARRVA